MVLNAVYLRDNLYYFAELLYYPPKDKKNSVLHRQSYIFI